MGLEKTKGMRGEVGDLNEKPKHFEVFSHR